jgi:hypothetical protein
MSKCILEYLDIDEKINGRAHKMTFCCRVEVPERISNPAAVIHDLQGRLVATFLQALVDKGVVEEEFVEGYLPPKPRKEVETW